MTSVSTARRNLKKAQADYAAVDAAAQRDIDLKLDTTANLAARGRADRAVRKATEALKDAKLAAKK